MIVILSVQIVDSFSAFLALKSQWDQLLERGQLSNVFLTHEWIEGWWSCFGGDHHRDMFILIFRRGDDIVAIAPLMKVRVLGVNWLLFIGHEISDYEDIITTGDGLSREEILKTLFDFLSKRHDWDLFFLRKIRMSSPNYSSLSAVSKWKNVGLGQKFFHHKQGVFYIDLTQGKEKFYSGLKRVFKTDSRRRRRRLEDQGSVNYERVSAIEEVLPAMEQLRDWHLARRHEKGQETFFENDRYRLFFETVCRSLIRRGILHLSVLKLEGKTVAMHFGFEHGKEFFYYIPVFDASLKSYAVGRLLCLELLEDAFRKGLRRFDFMLGVEEYKKDWNPSFEPLATFMCFPMTMRGRILCFIMNDFVIFIKKIFGKAW